MQISHKAKAILFIMFCEIPQSEIWEVFNNGNEKGVFDDDVIAYLGVYYVSISSSLWAEGPNSMAGDAIVVIYVCIWDFTWSICCFVACHVKVLCCVPYSYWKSSYFHRKCWNFIFKYPEYLKKIRWYLIF